MRPLFIIGNKRSGTSQLVRILNLHPEIFISHESDLVWILHQFDQGRPFAAHPWDSDVGMKHTLSAAGHLLDHTRTPWENFQTVTQFLMEQGTPWLPPQKKLGLRWMGDKKPFQQTDPQLLPYLQRHFPDAKFLHIVRHPAAVVASSDKFNSTGDGDFWQGLTAEEKIERWAFHEQLVADMKAQLPDRIHSLRYEDFCRWTEVELAGVFRFLELSPPQTVLRDAARQTFPARRSYPRCHGSPLALETARRHGYNPEKPAGKCQVLADHWYWKIVKKFH
jgi:hypothetical protein